VDVFTLGGDQQNIHDGAHTWKPSQEEQITPAGQARADTNAQHTRQDASISKGLQSC